MSILSGPEIHRQVQAGAIVIDPYDPVRLNPNSYNVRLGRTLKVYDEAILDMRRKPRTTELIIPDAGLLLDRGRGYLATTVERISGQGFVPILNGRSSMGRLFLQVHQTAGFGDDGFDGQFTMELICLDRPVRIYAHTEIAQISFEPIIGERQPYRGKYQHQSGPTASELHRDFE